VIADKCTKVDRAKWNFELTCFWMVRFLPEPITRRELRALERLNIDADLGAISHQVLHRLVILGLAKECAGRLLITYDGILLIGREKPAG
jgi:hypothetical protein